MLNIFVCEDDTVQRKSIVQIIKNTVLIEELDMQLILDTPNPYELLETVKTSQNTGIYFLDIDLKCDMNGMKLAQQIRLYDPRCFIIFVTSHSELSYMTFQYRVEAMDFVCIVTHNNEHCRCGNGFLQRQCFYSPIYPISISQPPFL